jgi:hypothetical protein
MKVLFNASFGAGFAFSDDFNAEYTARTGASPRTFERLLPSAESIRVDAIAVAIVEEKGAEWASGPHAAIEVREIPDIFYRYWSVDEYEGEESVRVDVNEALADILHTFMESGDRIVLERQYKAIMDAERAMLGEPAIVPKEESREPRILRQQSYIEGNGYSYFDIGHGHS